MDETTAADQESTGKPVGPGNFTVNGVGNYTPTTAVNQAVCPAETASVDGKGNCPIDWQDCTVGKYNHQKANTTHNSLCLPCALDTYMDLTTAADQESTCKPVGPGNFTVNGVGNYDPEGAVSQAACPDERASVDGKGNCPIDWQACTVGQYNHQKANTTHNSLCLPCALNTYMDETTAADQESTCKPVGPGNFAVNGVGNYTPTGAVSQAACPLGTTSGGVGESRPLYLLHISVRK